MDGFWNWLIGEAGAGWIFGLLGVIGGLYAWLRRGRPGRVIAQEVSRTQLLDIHSSQRDRLTVYYTEPDGEQAQIADLVQTEWVVYNGGSRDILEPLSITLSPEDEEYTGFMRVFGQNTWYRGFVVRDEESKEVSGIRFEFDYLNGYQDHEEVARFFILSEKSFSVRLIEGSGRGWSAMLTDPVGSPTKTISILEIVLLAIMMIGIVGLFLFFPELAFTPLGTGYDWEQNWSFTMLVSILFASISALCFMLFRGMVIDAHRRWRFGLKYIAATDDKKPEPNRMQYSLAWMMASYWKQRRRDS